MSKKEELEKLKQKMKDLKQQQKKLKEEIDRIAEEPPTPIKNPDFSRLLCTMEKYINEVRGQPDSEYHEVSPDDVLHDLWTTVYGEDIHDWFKVMDRYIEE